MYSHEKNHAKKNIMIDCQMAIDIILQNYKCFHCNKPITYSSLVQNKGDWYEGKYYCSSHIYYPNKMRQRHEYEKVLEYLAQDFGGLETGEEPRQIIKRRSKLL
jgi:hypothetical protein